MRSIIGSMTVEQIIRERQKLATEVLDGSKEEMARIGLNVDALQIQSIDDDGLGYINAMSAPHNAAIQQQAQIAQAQANQAAAEAEQESQRKQAEFARETAIVKAQYKAEVDKAQAQAAQAGPLAEAQAQREVLAMRTELAQRAAELRQQELVAEVVKPAEAEAERYLKSSKRRLLGSRTQISRCSMAPTGSARWPPGWSRRAWPSSTRCAAGSSTMTTTKTARRSPDSRKMVRDNATRSLSQRFAPEVSPLADPAPGRSASKRR